MALTDNERIDLEEETSAEERQNYEQFIALYDASLRNLNEGEIVSGKVVAITSDSVVVDVGYKSEGRIAKEEFFDAEGKLPVAVGSEVEVLLERTRTSKAMSCSPTPKRRRCGCGRKWSRASARVA